MAQTPKRSKSKAPNKRTHLPALNPLELEAFQKRLEALRVVSGGAKSVVMKSMRAAANSQAETPQTVIKTLEPDEQERVRRASQDYARTLGGMNARGKAALMTMTDAEFEALLRGGE